jgi:hypothetical protein
LNDDREFLKKAAGLLTISTWIALQKYEAIKEVVAEEFCNSILYVLSCSSIVKKKSKDEVMKNGIVERVVKNQLKKQSNWTAALINDFKGSIKKSNVTSILRDYNRKIEKKFSALIPTELIPILNAFCSEFNRNPRNIKRTLNILQVIFELVKVKNIDEDDLVVVANNDAWPELSKQLVVWIFLCAAYPYRISFIAQVVLDFDQQRRMNDRVSKLHCSSVVVYGSSVHDSTIPDIEELPLAVFYAEYVEPYIYAIKSAEKLLKLDGDPDDFAIILSRMLFHKDHDDDDVDELPSILCKDILGPFIEESSKSEYIIKPVVVDDNEIDAEAVIEGKRGDDTMESIVIEEKKSEGKWSDDPLGRAYGRNDFMKLERPKSKDRAEYLSLLHYSFNLNPSMRRQISLELSTLTSQHDLFIKTKSDREKHEILTDVLDGRNIQTKKEVVMQGRKLHKVTRKKISSHDSHVHHTFNGRGGHRHNDDNDAMNMEELGVEINRSKPLSELIVGEVGTLLEALKLGKYKETLINNEIDGKCLMKCNTVEDVVNMGISIVVKASLLLDEIRKWKTTGVPTEYLSINPSASQDDDRNAEVKSPIVSYDPLTIL